MPWIIADEEGRICHARKKVYNTERGAKMGYRAALETYLQMHYLYDDDLDYGFYLSKVLPQDESFLGQVLAAAAEPVTDVPFQERRWNEITQHFKSVYTIREVTMDLKGV